MRIVYSTAHPEAQSLAQRLNEDQTLTNIHSLISLLCFLILHRKKHAKDIWRTTQHMSSQSSGKEGEEGDHTFIIPQRLAL